MIIQYSKGNKHTEDRLIKITTKEKEKFSIFKLAELCNQLAINELKMYKPSKKTKALYTQISGKADETHYGTFFLKEAIIEAIQHAEQGIDWAEPKNKNLIKRWCKKYKINFEGVEPELKRLHYGKQQELNNYE